MLSKSFHICFRLKSTTHTYMKLHAMWKGIWLQLFEICPRRILMCFFRLGLQSFLERKSREAACFPSHGDWLNAVTRPAQRTQCRKVYNTTTPLPGLKCVTSSLFEHNLLQCASSQLPCVPAQCGPTAVNKGARESQRQLKLHTVQSCVPSQNGFPNTIFFTLVPFVWQSCTQYGVTDNVNKYDTRERES